MDFSRADIITDEFEVMDNPILSDAGETYNEGVKTYTGNEGENIILEAIETTPVTYPPITEPGTIVTEAETDNGAGTQIVIQPSPAEKEKSNTGLIVALAIIGFLMFSKK